MSFDPIRRAADLWERRWGRRSAPQAMASATSVMRVQQLLLAQFDAALADLGLTFARFEALVLLTFSREDRLPMRVVGERLMIHATSATHIVQRLEAQGLVQRVPNPDDGRGVVVRLTEAGRAAVQAALSELLAFERSVLAAISPDERAQLAALLRRLLAPFERD